MPQGPTEVGSPNAAKLSDGNGTCDGELSEEVAAFHIPTAVAQALC